MAESDLREWMRAADLAMTLEGVPAWQRRLVTTRLMYGDSCLCTRDTRDGSIVSRETTCPKHGGVVLRNYWTEGGAALAPEAMSRPARLACCSRCGQSTAGFERLCTACRSLFFGEWATDNGPDDLPERHNRNYACKINLAENAGLEERS